MTSSIAELNRVKLMFQLQQIEMHIRGEIVPVMNLQEDDDEYVSQRSSS